MGKTFSGLENPALSCHIASTAIALHLPKMLENSELEIEQPIFGSY